MAKSTKSAKTGGSVKVSRSAQSGRFLVNRNAETGAFISTSGAKRFSVSTDQNGVMVVKIR